MAELPELTVRMEQVEKSLEKETAKNENAAKYTHRMIEDVQARYQEIALSFGRIESSFLEHLKDDKRMSIGIEALNERVRTVERLAWGAMGGLTVIAALIAMFSTYIIGLLK